MNIMNCTECSDKIWDYLDGTLSETEQTEIQAHLESCNVCKAELEEIANIRKELHGLPFVELPEGYHAELMQKLQEETKVLPFRKKKERRWKPYSLIAAALLIVAAIGGIDGIQKYQSVVLTAEEKTGVKSKEISPAKEIPAKGKAKTEIPTQPKAIPKKEPQAVPKETAQREVPKAEMQEPKVQEPKVQTDTSPKPLTPQKQSLQQMPLQSTPQPQTVEKIEVREDMPMTMSLRSENKAHTERNVNLFVEDTQKTLSALRQLGESLDIWEEDAGEDFILFSMTKEQTSTFYAKLNELGTPEIMEGEEENQDIVLIKVVIKTQ